MIWGSNFLFWARSALALCVLVGCESTGVGNPGVVQLLLTSDDAVEPAAEDTAQLEGESLTRAVLVLGRITFLACDSDAEDVAVDGPFTVDLTSGRVDPEIAPVSLPPGGFCGLDATLAPALGPRLLMGRSLLFSGQREDGTRFILVGDVPGTLRVRPMSEGAFDQGEHDWLWALRPRRWLSPTELDGVNADMGTPVLAVRDALTDASDTGLIVIHVNRHPLLYAAIRSRLAARSTLYLDENDNHELDEAELNGDALIGSGIDDTE
jgi:hypothetical protein